MKKYEDNVSGKVGSVDLCLILAVESLKEVHNQWEIKEI